MALEKDHCDLCGKKVTPRDFEKGRAIILLKKAMCRACTERMVERGKEKPASKPASGGHKSRASTRTGVKEGPPLKPGFKAGDHVCNLYSSEAERQSQVARYLSEGLRLGEKVVYAVDENSNARVLGYLAKEGVATDRYLQTGQLEIHSSRNVYAPDGTFDPSQMIARFKILSDQAIKEGYKRLRGTAEMTWAFRGWPGSQRLVEYELRLNAAIHGGRCVALCQYDTSRFSPSLLQQIKAAHTLCIPTAG